MGRIYVGQSSGSRGIQRRNTWMPNVRTTRPQFLLLLLFWVPACSGLRSGISSDEFARVEPTGSGAHPACLRTFEGWEEARPAPTQAEAALRFLDLLTREAWILTTSPPEESGDASVWHGLVDSLWRVDSVAAAQATALLMNPLRAGLGIASLASTGYRRRSGAGIPALYFSPPPVELTQARLVLSAIHEAPSDREQRQVLWYACDAAWALSSLARDSQYYSSYKRAPSDFPWVHEALEVLREATRLLRPQFSEVLSVIDSQLGLSDPHRWP